MSTNYFITIPEKLLQDERLSPFQMILYGKLAFRANQKGYCEDRNIWLANVLKVGGKTLIGRKNKISRDISNLEKCGYIKVELDKTEKHNDKRKIYILGDTTQAPRNDNSMDNKNICKRPNDCDCANCWVPF